MIFMVKCSCSTRLTRKDSFCIFFRTHFKVLHYFIYHITFLKLFFPKYIFPTQSSKHHLQLSLQMDPKSTFEPKSHPLDCKRRWKKKKKKLNCERKIINFLFKNLNSIGIHHISSFFIYLLFWSKFLHKSTKVELLFFYFCWEVRG